VIVCLKACAHRPSPTWQGTLPNTIRGQHLQGRLIDIRDLRFISFDTLVDAVRRAEVVAVGEEHYHAAIQAFELQLLRALAQRKPQQLALSMEFLERDQQATVDAYLSGSMKKETFLKRLNASSAFMQHYFPLVHYAQQVGIPVIAMNAPRHIARQVAEHGLIQTMQGLSALDRSYLPVLLGNISNAYRGYFLDAVAESHALTEDQAMRFVEASYLKDMTMATVLATFLAQHPTFTVLAIAGRFHFDYGLAIPTLLRQQRRDVVIRQITTMAIDSDQTFDLQPLVQDTIADYLHLVAPAHEEHECSK
ncbi:MAG: ChaN family lipoprotein, partial [bacterium]|nr:ChaN family lipoprotein [bacterium]